MAPDRCHAQAGSAAGSPDRIRRDHFRRGRQVDGALGLRGFHRASRWGGVEEGWHFPTAV